MCVVLVVLGFACCERILIFGLKGCLFLTRWFDGFFCPCMAAVYSGKF